MSYPEQESDELRPFRNLSVTYRSIYLSRNCFLSIQPKIDHLSSVLFFDPTKIRVNYLREGLIKWYQSTILKIDSFLGLFLILFSVTNSLFSGFQSSFYFLSVWFCFLYCLFLSPLSVSCSSLFGFIFDFCFLGLISLKSPDLSNTQQYSMYSVGIKRADKEIA